MSHTKQEQLREYWQILEGSKSLFVPGISTAVEEPDLSALVNLEQHSSSTPFSSAGLSELEQMVSECQKCRLHASRKLTVFGKGATRPKVMIIGEAPGKSEDESGLPFVGRSGEYLDRWMQAIGLERDKDLFIGNIIKCRPPENRDPSADEQAACLPYLKRQLELLQPMTILCLGRIAAQILLDSQLPIGRLRAQEHSYESIPMVVTYHPSAVLRYPEKYRRPVWEDLKLLDGIIKRIEAENS